MRIEIGDRIQISAELLKAIYESEDHESQTVIVEDIFEDGGVKILALSPDEKR